MRSSEAEHLAAGFPVQRVHGTPAARKRFPAAGGHLKLAGALAALLLMLAGAGCGSPAPTGTLRITATNNAGIATFTLPGGRYAISVPTCGSTGKIAATVIPPQSTSLTWPCPIP